MRHLVPNITALFEGQSCLPILADLSGDSDLTFAKSEKTNMIIGVDYIVSNESVSLEVPFRLARSKLHA